MGGAGNTQEEGCGSLGMGCAESKPPPSRKQPARLSPKNHSPPPPSRLRGALQKPEKQQVLRAGGGTRPAAAAAAAPAGNNDPETPLRRPSQGSNPPYYHHAPSSASRSRGDQQDLFSTSARCTSVNTSYSAAARTPLRKEGGGFTDPEYSVNLDDSVTRPQYADVTVTSKDVTVTAPARQRVGSAPPSAQPQQPPPSGHHTRARAGSAAVSRQALPPTSPKNGVRPVRSLSQSARLRGGGSSSGLFTPPDRDVATPLASSTTSDRMVIPKLNFEASLKGANDAPAPETLRVKVTHDNGVNKGVPPEIGPYTVTGFLGKGTWAVVHECLHKQRKRKYAVKTFNKAKLSQSDLHHSGKREARLLKKLAGHPNVCGLIDALDSQRWYHIVVDLGGRELQEIIDRKPLTEGQAVKYSQELLQAVEFIHAAGICHRDIKPSNILVEKTLKLTDFGLGEFTSSNGRHHDLLTEVCGTPDYIAPEILGESAYDGTKADMWSVGVTLFVMVVGRPPWAGTSQKFRKREVIEGNWQNPKNKAVLQNFSTSYNQLLGSLLEVCPDRRLWAPEALQHSWFASTQPSARLPCTPRMVVPLERLPSGTIAVSTTPRTPRGPSATAADTPKAGRAAALRAAAAGGQRPTTPRGGVYI